MLSASEAGDLDAAGRLGADAGLFMLTSDEGDFAGLFPFALTVALLGGCDDVALVTGEGDATGDFLIAFELLGALGAGEAAFEVLLGSLRPRDGDLGGRPRLGAGDRPREPLGFRLLECERETAMAH